MGLAVCSPSKIQSLKAIHNWLLAQKMMKILQIIAFLLYLQCL